MTITTNVQALEAANNLNAAQTHLDKSLARLSSGSKILSAADDAAGIAVSSRLDAQIKRTDAARSNVQNALSFTQTQDGYMARIGQALSRMSELSVLAQDETKNDTDRVLYDLEFQQLATYINATSTKDFDGVSLFSSNTLTVTLDSDNSSSMTMQGIDLVTSMATAIGSSISNTTAAAAAIDAVKIAITQLSNDRAIVGSYQTRLNYAADQLSVGKENLTAASSNITDVDVANESTEFSRQNILLQSTTAMLAQANQMPQTVLKLLQ